VRPEEGNSRGSLPRADQPFDQHQPFGPGKRKRPSKAVRLPFSSLADPRLDAPYLRLIIIPRLWASPASQSCLLVFLQFLLSGQSLVGADPAICDPATQRPQRSMDPYAHAPDEMEEMA